MFIFKQGSRNAMNLDRSNPDFADNFFKIFGKRLPHMDTVDAVFSVLSNDEIERLKASLVASLIEKKVLGKFRLLDSYYRVAIDGTGVMTVPQGHCDHCLTKKSANGVVTYFHNILEAKLITPNGFAISLCSEWIENPDEYVKQDCELKAFKRLADKLKEHFPKLPICLHADGLYSNKTFFDICHKKNWRFIVTLKDASLKLLWEEVEMQLLTSKARREIRRQTVIQDLRWVNDLRHNEQNLSWIECRETKGGETTRFVHVSDISVTEANVEELATSGRLRFKIENEGFNTQKNLGYSLEHKYSRVSYTAAKNYVSAMQIAHLLNQLYELSDQCQPLLKEKVTLKYLWKRLLSALTDTILDGELFITGPGRFQIRYE